jgi:hypothetical protein
VEVIKKGSIEPLLIPLRDRLENITSLAAVSSLRFDTIDPAGDAIETDVPCSHEGDLTAICLITSTNADYVVGDECRLYLKFTLGSESPILGPTKFRIEDD